MFRSLSMMIPFCAYRSDGGAPPGFGPPNVNVRKPVTARSAVPGSHLGRD